MTTSKSFGLKALLIAALFAPTIALAQTAAPAPDSAAPSDDDYKTKTFACQDGHQMSIQFQTRNSDLHAIVDTGAGPHDLVLKPWKLGDEPDIIWTDGVRTLTWSTGVQLMLMDGSNHIMCGGEHHH